MNKDQRQGETAVEFITRNSKHIRAFQISKWASLTKGDQVAVPFKGPDPYVIYWNDGETTLNIFNEETKNEN